MKTVHCVDVNRNHFYVVEAETERGIAWAIAGCGWTLTNDVSLKPEERGIVNQIRQRESLELPPVYFDAARHPWYLIEPASEKTQGRMCFDVPAAFTSSLWWKIQGQNGQSFIGRFLDVTWPDPAASDQEPRITISCQQLILSAPLSWGARLEAAPVHDCPPPESGALFILQQHLPRIGARYICTPVVSHPGRARIQTPWQLPDGDVLDLFGDTRGDWLILSDAGEALRFLLQQTTEARLPPLIDAWVSDICTGKRVEQKGRTLEVWVKREEGDVVEAMQRLIETVLSVTALHCLLLPGHHQGEGEHACGGRLDPFHESTGQM